ncbi:MAG: CoA-binding protein [Rhodospirillales bacterium]|nr:CoA-binding protein [Rhodospirillales bacterium]
MAGPVSASKTPAPAKPLHYDDDHIRGILRQVRTIAVVGASPNWVRPSNFVMKYLQGKGFRVIPVNPGHDGKEILGEMTYATLSDIPGSIDMVDIFRASEYAEAIADEVLDIFKDKGIGVFWMQLGVRNDAAAKRLKKADISVIMNRCPKIEYGRLFGELGWCGVNSGIISAKRRPMVAR